MRSVPVVPADKCPITIVVGTWGNTCRGVPSISSPRCRRRPCIPVPTVTRRGPEDGWASDQVVGLDPVPDSLSGLGDPVQAALPPVLGDEEFDEGVLS